MSRMIDEFVAAGFSGITNVPTAGLYDGAFRRHIDATGLGYPKEVELIAACRARDVFTLAYAFSPAEARAMAEAGADIIGVHVGLTSGGWIGAEETLELDAACASTQAMLEAAKAGRGGRPDRGPRRALRGSGDGRPGLRDDRRRGLPRGLVDRATPGGTRGRRHRRGVQGAPAADVGALMGRGNPPPVRRET